MEALRQLVASLTPRETEVFALVVAGKLNKQIAYELGTTERTIKAHRKQVMAKLHARSAVDLFLLAQRLGLKTATPVTADS
jgi:DNA-binding NarL/FixJ family response regulator